MSNETHPLEEVDAIQRNKDWLEQWDSFMSDPELQEALDLAIKIIAKPNVPQQRVATLCVRLEAYAVVFRMRYTENMMWTKNGKDASAKKNSYRSMYDGIDRLVDSLKYLMKNG